MGTTAEQPDEDSGAEDVVHLYRDMSRIRAFELAVAESYRNAEIPGFVHLSLGQEASAVGLCAALEPDDRITTTHRGHAHLLARGVPTAALMAELFGKATGVCRGYGGSMHSMSLEHGVLGANGIVGAGLPIAVGSAFEQRYRATNGVTVAFFGEGAVSTGSVHEFFVLAASLGAPVLFVCEFNGWVEFSRFAQLLPFPSLTNWAEQYGLVSVGLPDGEVRTVRAGARRLLPGVRSGRPGFLLVPTSRLRGHYEGDSESYRHDEVPQIDPMDLIRASVPPEVVREVESEINQEIEAALAEARSAPWPTVEAMRRA